MGVSSSSTSPLNKTELFTLPSEFVKDKWPIETVSNFMFHFSQLIGFANYASRNTEMEAQTVNYTCFLYQSSDKTEFVNFFARWLVDHRENLLNLGNHYIMNMGIVHNINGQTLPLGSIYKMASKNIAKEIRCHVRNIFVVLTEGLMARRVLKISLILDQKEITKESFDVIRPLWERGDIDNIELLVSGNMAVPIFVNQIMKTAEAAVENSVPSMVNLSKKVSSIVKAATDILTGDDE